MKRFLSWIYGVGVWIRNFLYDEKMLISHSVNVPTICVGNLAVGGTGKTPMVEYLIQLLQDHYQIAVLSRGYKRKTRGFILAGDSDTAHTIGDEAMQIHRKFPNVTVAVCEDRVHGVRQLQKRIEGLQLVILDDAFQHRAIRSGYKVLLTAADNLYVNDHLLPYGRLREHTHQAHRADIIVVTRCPQSMTPIQRRIISNNLKIAPYQHLVFAETHYSHSCQNLSLPVPTLGLSGIADPHYFEQYIAEQWGVEHFMRFGDHHSFTPKDIQQIRAYVEKHNIQHILTTEKDYMRMVHSPIYSDTLLQMTSYLPMQQLIVGTDRELFDKLILRYVQENNRTKD